MPYVWPTLIFSYTDLWNIRVQHKHSHFGRSDAAPCAAGETRRQPTVCQDTPAHGNLNYRRKSSVPGIDRRTFTSKTFLDNRKLELLLWFKQYVHFDIFLNSQHDTLPSDQIPILQGIASLARQQSRCVPCTAGFLCDKRHCVQGHGKKKTPAAPDTLLLNKP